ncbi:hypothetical protein GGR53DRAFT_123757 [Hypoxylon sp. FL1150]|nr:hypothetical protein GGR53DRAFT_123757 [Hypoxylon sp. FL1150]
MSKHSVHSVIPGHLLCIRIRQFALLLVLYVKVVTSHASHASLSVAFRVSHLRFETTCSIRHYIGWKLLFLPSLWSWVSGLLGVLEDFCRDEYNHACGILF